MLSWSKWLVTYWDGLPTRSWSPIQVLRRPDIEQQLWSRPMRNCEVRPLLTWPDGSYATPTAMLLNTILNVIFLLYGTSIVFDMKQRAGLCHISAGNILLFNNYAECLAVSNTAWRHDVQCHRKPLPCHVVCSCDCLQNQAPSLHRPGDRPWS